MRCLKDELDVLAISSDAAGCSLPRERALSIAGASTSSSPITAHFATKGRSDG